LPDTARDFSIGGTLARKSIPKKFYASGSARYQPSRVVYRKNTTIGRPHPIYKYVLNGRYTRLSKYLLLTVISFDSPLEIQACLLKIAS